MTEVYRAVESIIDTAQNDIWVVQAYLQIILARCIPMMKLVEKSKIGSDDIIYRTVSYISANFNKSISLDGMAHDLGVSKFSLSRLFSKTFHSSFNQYVNEARLKGIAGSLPVKQHKNKVTNRYFKHNIYYVF